MSKFRHRVRIGRVMVDPGWLHVDDGAVERPDQDFYGLDLSTGILRNRYFHLDNNGNRVDHLLMLTRILQAATDPVQDGNLRIEFTGGHSISTMLLPTSYIDGDNSRPDGGRLNFAPYVFQPPLAQGETIEDLQGQRMQFILDGNRLTNRVEPTFFLDTWGSIESASAPGLLVAVQGIGQPESTSLAVAVAIRGNRSLLPLHFFVLDGVSYDIRETSIDRDEITMLGESRGFV